MASEQHGWQRIEATNGEPGESAQAYEAAKLYFEMAANRSLEAVAQKLHKSKTIVARWSGRWRWVERAADYDRYVDAHREDGLQQARASDAQKWIERDEALRERFYSLGEVILEKMERMIREFPERDISRTETRDGQTVTINIRTQHSLSGLAQMLGAGAELQRLAVGIQPGSSPLDNLDMDQLSTEDIKALADGRAIKLEKEG